MGLEGHPAEHIFLLGLDFCLRCSNKVSCWRVVQSAGRLGLVQTRTEHMVTLDGFENVRSNLTKTQGALRLQFSMYWQAV